MGNGGTVCADDGFITSLENPEIGRTHHHWLPYFLFQSTDGDTLSNTAVSTSSCLIKRNFSLDLNMER